MLNKKILKDLKESVALEDLRIKNRIFNKTAFVNLVTDYYDNLDKVFNIEIGTHGVLDQKATGRCWSYAGLNILREKVIEKCNLENFELSGSYIAFYDKLERFSYLMDKLEDYSKKGNEYDRDIQRILKTGFDDGSNFTEFKVLIKKYGVVPKNKYSNSFQTNDTGELNDILSRLLRKYYLNLGDKNAKETYLKQVYKILTMVYGSPVDRFDFEYKDRKGVYHIDKSITPNQFYDKYIGIDFSNYIEIYTFQDEKYKYNNMYDQKENTQIDLKNESLILNLEYKELEKLILKQLKKNESVYFSSSTTTKYSNGLWIDLLDRYSSLLDIDLKMSNNEIKRTYGTQGEHTMLITGASLKNDKVVFWKIENSWGEREGLNGYFIAESKFLENYIISAVINKKYLNKNQKELLKKKPIIVDKYDYRFC